MNNELKLKIKNEIEEMKIEIIKYNKGKAQIWSYSCSHSILKLKVINYKMGKVLFITIMGCTYIEGPTKWDECDFDIEIIENEHGYDKFLIFDNKSKFKSIGYNIILNQGNI